jgi:polyphosphate kinase
MALLETCLADNRQAWELAPDGSYTQRTPVEGKEFATHKVLLRDSWGQLRESGGKGVIPAQVPAVAFG